MRGRCNSTKEGFIIGEKRRLVFWPVYLDSIPPISRHSVNGVFDQQQRNDDLRDID